MSRQCRSSASRTSLPCHAAESDRELHCQCCAGRCRLIGERCGGRSVTAGAFDESGLLQNRERLNPNGEPGEQQPGAQPLRICSIRCGERPRHWRSNRKPRGTAPGDRVRRNGYMATAGTGGTVEHILSRMVGENERLQPAPWQVLANRRATRCNNGLSSVGR